MPFIEAEKQKHDRRRGLLQPVEAIFDVLSRGQYAAANVGDEIRRALFEGDQTSLGELGGAAYRGFSGQQKGDWEDVFFANTPKEDRTTIQKGIGFLGNVILDPFNFLGVGPTRKAISAAREFSRRAVEQGARRLTNLGRMASLAQKNFDAVEYARLLKDAPQQAGEYALRHGGANVAREMDTLSRKAFQEGLRTPGPELRSNFVGRLNDEAAAIIDFQSTGLVESYMEREITSMTRRLGKGGMSEKTALTVQKRLDLFTTKGDEVLEKYSSGVRRVLDGSSPEVRLPKWLRERADDVVEKRLTPIRDTILDTEADKFFDLEQGLGERGITTFGGEFGKGVRQPNVITKQWQDLKLTFGTTPLGEKFSDAWWWVLNNKGVGTIRRAIGFRNHYQKMLNVKQADQRAGLTDRISRDVLKVRHAIGETTEDTRQIYLRLAGIAEVESAALTQARGQKAEVLIDDLLLREDILQRFGYGQADLGEVSALAARISNVTRPWAQEYSVWSAGGYVKGMGDIVEYLPVYLRDSGAFQSAKRSPRARGSYAPGFAETRTFPLDETFAQEKAKFKLLFGAPDDVAEKLVADGHSLLVTDLEEILTGRAIAQAKVALRVEMLNDFKHFGINLKEIQPRASLGSADIAPETFNISEYNKKPLWEALTRNDGALQELRLRKSKDNFFKDYLFDEEVVTVLDRAVTILEDDASMSAFRRLSRKYSSWWKSTVTATTGFHLRNLYSNQVTGFLRHGIAWFNIKRYAAPATLGAQYGLYGEGGLAQVKKLMGTAKVEQIMNTRWGGYTVRELGDYARRTGVVTPYTRQADAPNTVQRLTQKPTGEEKANPFSNEFILFEASRKTGAIVESTSRMQMFLMDIERISGRTIKEGEFAQEHVIEYAKEQSKKWFIDYTNLTPFEQRVRESGIPFYSWLRYNLSNQISGLIEAPYMYSIIPKAQRAATLREGEGGLKREDIPEWMIETGFFPISKEGEGQYKMLRTNFPYQDLNIFPALFEGNITAPVFDFREWRDNMLANAHPMIKTAIEIIPTRGFDTFRRQDLGIDAPAPRVLRLFTRSPKLLGVVDSFLRYAGVNDGIKASTDQDGRLHIDAKIARVLENNIPVLRMWAEYMDLPIEMTERLGFGIEEAITRATGAVDDYQGAEEMLQIMSKWVGIKQKVIDEETERESRAFDIYRAAQEQRTQSRRGTPAQQHRSATYRSNQLNQYRRLGLIE